MSRSKCNARFPEEAEEGVATPQAEIDLIKARLKLAEELHKAWQREEEEA